MANMTTTTAPTMAQDTDSFIRQIEARAALDAYERASDIYDVFCACALNEGADPETDYNCNLAKTKRELAKLYLRDLLKVSENA